MGLSTEMFRPRAPVARQMQLVGLRKLYLLDLVSDAVNGPVGLGVFVLLGLVARTLSGPSVVVSVTFAAVVAIIAGLCYLELGSTKTKTGNSPTLSLNLGSVGELISFLVTWNLIADLAIGAACASRGFRASIDTVADDSLKNFFLENVPLNSTSTSEFVDIVALAVPIVASLFCCAFREILMFKLANTLFAFVVFLFMIFAAIPDAKGEYWTSTNYGGFIPFGMQKTFQGASILAIAFVDFRKAAYPSRYTDCKRPAAVILSSICSFLLVFSVGVMVTLLVPYFDLEEGNEVVGAYTKLHFKEGMWIVAISAIMILLHSVLTLIYTISQELNSLATEHLVFNVMGNVDVFGRKRPIFIVCFGIASGLLGAFFKEEQLAEAISIGTLVSFGLVACSAIIHRCQYEAHSMETCSFKDVAKQFVNCVKTEKPTYVTSACVKIALALYSLLCLGGSALIVHFGNEIGSGEVWAVVTLIVVAVLALYVFTIIVLQPQIKRDVDDFAVPLFPLFNGLGILFTSYLLMSMSHIAWYTLAGWSLIGFVIYLVNLCARPQIMSPLHSKAGSNSDVFNLVPAGQLKNSVNSTSLAMTVTEMISPTPSPAMREVEWKPQDQRRNGWIEDEENEIEIPIVVKEDSISLKSEPDVPKEDGEVATTSLVEISIPEIVITEIVNAGAAADSPAVEHDTPEFYARQLDEIFTFEVAGASSSSSSSSDEDVDEDTGEALPEKPLGSPKPAVHFANLDPLTSSDDDLDADEPEEEIIVSPASPAPPPLPPANLLISAHLSARGRAPVVPDTPTSPIPEVEVEVENEKDTSHLNDFQKELRNTLKLRSQKMIDSIENATVNVNEGIEIFGGGRSASEESAEPPQPPVQPTIKAGKLENHAFVEKLDSILKSQMDDSKLRPKAKVYKQKRVVVVEELGQKAQMRFSAAELTTAKMKLRSSTGDSPGVFFDSAPEPVEQEIVLQPVPKPRVKKEPKSLSALDFQGEVEIIGMD